MEQFPGGTSFVGDSHTTARAGKAAGEKGLPALGLDSPVTARTFQNRCLVYVVHFSSCGAGHVRGRWLRGLERPRRNSESRKSGGLLQFCDATVRSPQWRSRTVRQGTEDVRQHPSGASSAGGTTERGKPSCRNPTSAGTSGADRLGGR